MCRKLVVLVNSCCFLFTRVCAECGGLLTAPTAVIASPNYPGLYAHARVCVWHIRVDAARRVLLTFSDFDLEGSFDCRFDHVEVRTPLPPLSHKPLTTNHHPPPRAWKRAVLSV